MATKGNKTRAKQILSLLAALSGTKRRYHQLEKNHSWKKMCIKNKNKALLVNKGQFQKTTGNF